jgi:hypothetical protein
MAENGSREVVRDVPGTHRRGELCRAFFGFLFDNAGLGAAVRDPFFSGVTHSGGVNWPFIVSAMEYTPSRNQRKWFRSSNCGI